MVADHLGGGLRGVGGGRAVAETVDQASQPAGGRRREDREVAGAVLALQRGTGDAEVERVRPAGYLVHFTSVTVVPAPGAVSIWNSSTSRRAPGSPRPRPPPVV